MMVGPPKSKLVNKFRRCGHVQNMSANTKNTGHLEWNALGDFSEFKTNGGSKEAL